MPRHLKSRARSKRFHDVPARLLRARLFAMRFSRPLFVFLYVSIVTVHSSAARSAE